MAVVAYGHGSGTSTASVTGLNTTGAKFLVMALSANANDSDSPSDNKSNSWQELTVYTHSGAYIRILYAENPTVGSGHDFSVTMAFRFPSIVVAAFDDNIALTSSFDQQNGANSAASPGSVTPGVANELIIAALTSGGTGPPVPQINNSFNLVDYDTTAGQNAALAWKISSSAESPAFTAASGSFFETASAIATFKPIAGGISGTFLNANGPGSITVTGVSETVNVANGKGTVTVTGSAGTFNADNGIGKFIIA